MAVSDDEVIRRRLLIEGDGGNDDRKINSLLKTFLNWSSMRESAEESNVTYQRMLAQLAQCELAMEKSLLVHDMNVREQSNYQKLNQEIEQNIQLAMEKILDCKSELHKAKRIRRNRQEYDALAKVIQQHPNRQDTLRQLETLDKELEGLKETKKTIEEKLEMRKKQFHLLIAAIHEMQRLLEEDEKKEELEMETS